jgi:hypothetical protein
LAPTIISMYLSDVSLAKILFTSLTHKLYNPHQQ